LNVGPRPDGTLDPESVKRLEGIGEWLAQFGQTIYGTRGGPIAPQSWGVTTQTPEKVYLHILDRSQTNGEGWLALAGTEHLDALHVGPVDNNLQIATRTNAGGLLEVKLAEDADAVDVVLAVAK
jgi:alpha-L-fucosidase